MVLSETELIQITTTDLSIDVLGPVESRRGALRGAHRSRNGTLRLNSKTGQQVLSCYWRRPDGEFNAQDVADEGPWLFENTTYRVAVAGPKGTEVSISHRLSDVTANLSPAPSYRNVVTGTINFGQQIGYSELVILIGGVPVFSITLEVFPTKIDYDHDYFELLQDLTAVSRTLCLQYLSATELGASPARSLTAEDLEFLLLLRHNIGRLTQAVRYIERSPDRKLLRDIDYIRPDKVRRVSRETLSAIAKGSGRGGHYVVNGVRIRELVPHRSPTETLDTPEHRWIRQRLTGVQRRLGAIALSLASDKNDAEARGLSTAKILTQMSEVDAFRGAITAGLRSDFLSEVTGPPPIGFSSLVLQVKPGYREVYNILLLIEAGLKIRGIEQVVPGKVCRNVLALLPGAGAAAVQLLRYEAQAKGPNGISQPHA